MITSPIAPAGADGAVNVIPVPGVADAEVMVEYSVSLLVQVISGGTSPLAPQVRLVLLYVYVDGVVLDQFAAARVAV